MQSNAKSAIVLTIFLATTLAAFVLGALFYKLIDETDMKHQMYIDQCVDAAEDLRSTKRDLDRLYEQLEDLEERLGIFVTTDNHLDPKQKIELYVDTICAHYDKVDASLVKALIERESDFQWDVTNKDTGCAGLMQLNPDLFVPRLKALQLTDIYDPWSNILAGVDFLQELFEKYEDPALVLMLYNMKWKTAFELYEKGEISSYATEILNRAEYYEKEDTPWDVVQVTNP